MSMGFIGSPGYNPFATRDLFEEATPKVKRGGLAGRTETRSEGFMTEECSKIAKKIVKGFDQNPDKYLKAFADILRVKMLTDKTSATKTVETLMYEAFSEAFRNHFEKATYNGPKSKHMGKDLFTRPRAHAKAQLLAYELTTRLLKNKRALSLASLFRNVQDLIPTSDLSARPLEKERLICDIKPTIDASRTEALSDANTLFEEVTAKMRVVGAADKADSFVEHTFRKNKWETRLAACAAMQVPFGDTLKLGTTKNRKGEALPKEWSDYRTRALSVADHMCLRVTTQKTIDPFFRVAQSSSSKSFDQLIEILERLENKSPDIALKIFEAMDSDSQVLLRKLIADLEEAASEMPDIDINGSEIKRLNTAIHTTGSETKKAEFSQALAPLLFLASLSAVKQGIRMQAAKMRTLFETADAMAYPTKATMVTTPLSQSITDSPSRGTTPDPLRLSPASEGLSPEVMTELTSVLSKHPRRIAADPESGST